MIKIRKSETADSRSCDWSKVSKEQLLKSSRQHIGDVQKGLALWANMLYEVGRIHDADKLSEIDAFHEDFKTGFKKKDWWNNHKAINRHHLLEDVGVPEDVDLIDVLEYITDCVMAGMARSGSVYKIDLPNNLLQRAFQNTVSLLEESVEVVDGDEDEGKAE